ncbi:hypothetical protein B0J13DRAFT_463209 [Dactylonectria estremocensis]|uniref:Uncharacterized protein n=1 Tax=Dactylonectria estremocensis TaxID=1079267 RepID=A0A9P9I6T2_9HYPO|nr:hypothetical protein B0J13DRAFT_463209 [Dactylonectria estremocensis]
MSSLRKKPDDVVDGILKRAELSKLARRLQSLLALARFKTKHGWEDLTLDTIEPNFEEEIRQKRLAEGDTLSDSAFSASGLPYSSDTLMSLPLKPDLFSNAVGSRNKGTSHRKRTYLTSFENNPSSPSKRFRLSPTAHKSVGDHSFWKDSQGRAQPSPIKPCRQQHFTPVDQDSSFQLRLLNSGLTPLNLAAPSDDDDFLTVHSFNAANMRSSPLTGPPSTPPQKNSKLDLLSSMVTPGDGNLFPTTPDQGFDFADFVNVTPPSPAQKPWRNASSHAYHPNAP